MSHQYIELNGKRYRRVWSDNFRYWTHEVELKGVPGGWRRLERDRCAKRIAEIDAAFKAK